MKKSILITSILLVLSALFFTAGYLLLVNNLYVFLQYICFIISSILLIISIRYIFYLFSLKKITIKELVLISIQSAITVILYFYVKFNLPFFPPWLDIQVSEIPALITSFIYGPFAGSIVIVIRFLLKLPNSITVGVGEIADLLMGLVLVISSGLIYKKNHNIKGAILGITTGVILSTFTAVLANIYILIPAYTTLAGFSIEALTGMLSYIPNISVSNFMTYYILIGVIPFNLFRYLFVSIITFILYKKVHFLFDKLTK